MVKFCKNIIVIMLVLGGFSGGLSGGLSGGFMKVAAESVEVSDQQSEGAFTLIGHGKRASLITDKNDFPGVLIAAKSVDADLSRLGFDTVTPKNAIIAGTIGRSALIDSLIAKGAIDPTTIAGKWEGFLVAVVDKPTKDIDRALVIAGSDKRGTIFGLYDTIRRAGVSPWNWWADVPIVKRDSLYFSAGVRTDIPSVQYRGIFLNDENPALYGWVNEKFGGFNHKFYEKIFELILRHKANYLWPAMWGKAFYDDDPKNGALAHKMGVVIGTSHHEPLARAHVEWARYGEGKWDYTKNKDRLQKFWRKGVARKKDFEGLLTVGMRGDGDEAMTEGTAIQLLENIVADQRRIISEEMDMPASAVPQVWALYKEVQDYYDQGMKVPDDITLLFADDNWGNIRRLPKAGATRKGGYGVYYHFDYVGGPRNYKWLNTTQIERTWEQMHLAAEYGAKKLWIVNVGDLKPMELPISFFLDYAWAPSAMPLEEMKDYSNRWAAEQFGEKLAADIASILDRYTKYNARRKPEMLDADTYSLTQFNEASRVQDQWATLVTDTDKLLHHISPAAMDAYKQLVWFPVHASANLNKLYHAVALNRFYAEHNDLRANAAADQAEALFAHDAELTRIYHEDINDGKWNHLMSQTHIGYTYWQQPEKQTMPTVVRLDSGASGTANLPAATIQAKGATLTEGGYLSLHADQMSVKDGGNTHSWKVIPNLGQTGSAVTAFPVTKPTPQTAENGPYLGYDFTAATAVDLQIKLRFSPTLDFIGKGGLNVKVSLDDGEAVVINLHKDETHQDWQQWVGNNLNLQTLGLGSVKAGPHQLKIWHQDPGVVLQHITLSDGPLPDSYLPPPNNYSNEGKAQ